MIYNKKQRAFSLAEAMIALLIAALILAATMPVITKKHLILPTRGPHGKWACKYINNKMYHATAADQNSALPSNPDKWKEGCTFPVLPSNVPYMLIQVVGGGAGGNFDEGLPYLDFIKPEDTFNLPIATEADKEYEMGIAGNALEIPATAEYEVNVVGNKGTVGQLMDNFFEAFLVDPSGREYILANCEYPGAEPNPTIASVKYKKTYRAGDKLWLETQPDTKIDNYQKICPGGLVEGGAVAIFDGMSINLDWFTFKNIVSKPGSNGDRVFLKEKEYNKNNIEDLVEIEGGAGGMYVSNYSDNNCRFISCNRYTPIYTRDVGDYRMLVKKAPAGADIISGGSTSYVKAVSTTVDLRGGCGGGAGSVNSVLMARQDDTEEAPVIQLGHGGLPGKDGQATVFNQVTAKGGTGCSESTSPPVGEDAGTGGQGASAPTTYIGDSVGGAGGRGGYSTTAGNGAEGRGLGSGGGGGGAAINMSKEQVESYKETNQEYIKQRTTYGQGGNGASGGIIVSW